MSNASSSSSSSESSDSDSEYLGFDNVKAHGKFLGTDLEEETDSEDMDNDGI